MTYHVTHRYATAFQNPADYKNLAFKRATHDRVISAAIRRSYAQAFEPLEFVEFGLNDSWVPVYPTDSVAAVWSRWVMNQPGRIRRKVARHGG